MLENPEEEKYREFFKELLNIYKEAVRYQKDGRLSEGRAGKAELLQNRLEDLCTCAKEKIDEEKMIKHEVTFVKLQKELVRGIDALFTFVLYPEVEPTNNRSENVRREAEVRKGGRTSKSEKGAKRRSIIMTVLATLNTRFEKFTLENLLAEVQSWISAGYSIFQEELAEIEKANAPPVEFAS